MTLLTNEDKELLEKIIELMNEKNRLDIALNDEMGFDPISVIYNYDIKLENKGKHL